MPSFIANSQYGSIADPKPRVFLQLDVNGIHATPEEARQIAFAILDAAAGAIQDTAIVRVLKNHGLDEAQILTWFKTIKEVMSGLR